MNIKLLLLAGGAAALVAVVLVLGFNTTLSTDAQNGDPPRVATSAPPRPSPVSQDYNDAMDVLGYDGWGWSGEDVVPGFEFDPAVLTGVYPWSLASITDDEVSGRAVRWTSGEIRADVLDNGDVLDLLASGNHGDLVGSRAITMGISSHSDWKGEIGLTVFPTCRAAREALLAEWAVRPQSGNSDELNTPNWTMEPAWLQAEVGEVSDLGDVSVRSKLTGSPSNGECRVVCFLRRNVLVSVAVWGTNPDNTQAVDAIPAALALDAAILGVSTVDPADLDGHRPVISTTYERASLLAGYTSDILDNESESDVSITVISGSGDYFLVQGEVGNPKIVGIRDLATLVSPGRIDSYEPGTGQLVFVVVDKQTLLTGFRVDSMTSAAR